ncbi:MAG TPA: monovalent cation/H+ antiporter subunit D family protein [Candidatus Deferrimicrobium sp.]|nr:monovalent cation/H+ antiporter subunit D family protein [Candidatus Deferrimicrobium sp.]
MNHLAVLIPGPLLFAAFIVPLTGLLHKGLVPAVALLGVGLAAAASVLGMWTVVHQGTLRYHLGSWAPPLGIEYVLDPLAAFMALVVTVSGLLSLVYFSPALRHEVPDRFVTAHALALVFLAGLFGMIVTGDLFNLFVFLEIASLSAYALVAIGDKQAPVAALRYLILGSLAGSFYVLGVGFIYFVTGSLNMADVAQRLAPLYQSRAVVAAAILIALALALKMALFPFHLWLPDAYTYAPSAVAGLIPPVATKVAAYVMVRVFLGVFQPSFGFDRVALLPVVSWLAAAGIIYGSVMAIAQSDLRRMLAYSSVSQIAYVGLGLGMGNSLGLIGALLHVVNHAAMKACLFFVAGTVRQRTGQVQISNLTGLGRTMPWSMAAFTIAALSMIGVPPAAGFFSKWYLMLGALELANPWFVTVILLSSLLNAVYFFRVVENIYVKTTTVPGATVGAEAPPAMLAPTLITAAAVLVLGLANSVIVTQLLMPIAKSFYGR